MPINQNLADLATVLANFFDGLAAGNMGYAEVEDLSWNDGVLKFNIKIRHRQVFSEEILGKQVHFTVYDISTYIIGEINPLDMSHGEIKFCVKTPISDHPQCITLKSILKHIKDILVSKGLLMAPDGIPA